MKDTNKTDSELRQLVVDLCKVSSESKSQLWRRVADDLLKPTRNRRLVNIFKLDMFAQDGDVIVVPGKVLGTGDLHRKVTVAAFSFSDSAVAKIKEAKGTVLTIKELVTKNPSGKDVRVFG
ncbi:MAG TPA: 50S ribosomal protein L18e [Candidatus Nanoarchaeia archaeon]|nr:50S ribosomal protein L18e [Candidatus Nanoarchaeia archaeon]